MFLCSLASGSAGNCFALWSGDPGKEVGLLVDVGLSLRELRRRMDRRNINPDWFKAVLLTHAHDDHVHGLGSWLCRFPMRVYATAGTFLEIGDSHGRRVNQWGMPVRLRQEFYEHGFRILPLPTIHNAMEPVTYSISLNGSKVTMLLETGQVTNEMERESWYASCLVIESNHDPLMLSENENLPAVIKERIKGTHLSNSDCAAWLLNTESHPKVVVLSHLSAHNNHPELARSVAREALDQAGLRETTLVIATQNEPSEVVTA